MYLAAPEYTYGLISMRAFEFYLCQSVNAVIAMREADNEPCLLAYHKWGAREFIADDEDGEPHLVNLDERTIFAMDDDGEFTIQIYPKEEEDNEHC